MHLDRTRGNGATLALSAKTLSRREEKGIMNKQKHIVATPLVYGGVVFVERSKLILRLKALQLTMIPGLVTRVRML